MITLVTRVLRGIEARAGECFMLTTVFDYFILLTGIVCNRVEMNCNAVLGMKAY